MGSLVSYNFKRAIVNPEQVSFTYRIYSGDITTEDEYNPQTDQVEPITRYRRDALLDTKTVTFTKAEVVSLLQTYKKNKIANDLEAGSLEDLWEQWREFIITYFDQLINQEAIQRGKTAHKF